MWWKRSIRVKKGEGGKGRKREGRDGGKESTEIVQTGGIVKEGVVGR
jgi:hypothetical protein